MTESHHHEPLTEVELLVSNDKRRVSVDDHQSFRQSLALPTDLDDDDDLAADPILDHLPSRRSDRDLDRLLGILDGLKSNRKKSAQ